MARRKGAGSPPEMLVPSQLFDTMAGQTPRSPECRLIAAVLLDAALQLSRHGSKGAADAERWIRRTGGGDEAFSFVGVCEALRLEPTYLARGLLRWRARGASAAKLPTRQSGRGARVGRIATTEAATPTRCTVE